MVGELPELSLNNLIDRELGPLSSITTFGITMVIINDRQLAFEILEKRSAKHSSRARLVFADELYVRCSPFSPYI